MAETIKGTPVEVHYLAVFDHKQTIIGDALKLNPPAVIEMQLVDGKVGFQLKMPTPEGVGIVLSRPEIIGIALLNKDKQFLTGFSIPGNPELRQENEVYVVKSRYIILAPKRPPS
jgi:hypothetical protein